MEFKPESGHLLKPLVCPLYMKGQNSFLMESGAKKSSQFLSLVQYMKKTEMQN